MKYARARDANHGSIRDDLRDCGYEVRDIASLGDGMPDIIVKHRGTKRVRFMEIKDPSKPPSARKLTPAEEQVRDLLGELYVVVETLEDAIRAMNS